jgi:hypothetical protein
MPMGYRFAQPPANRSDPSGVHTADDTVIDGSSVGFQLRRRSIRKSQILRYSEGDHLARASPRITVQRMRA